jgi:hypothetical protein
MLWPTKDGPPLLVHATWPSFLLMPICVTIALAVRDTCTVDARPRQCTPPSLQETSSSVQRPALLPNSIGLYCSYARCLQPLFGPPRT